MALRIPGLGDYCIQAGTQRVKAETQIHTHMCYSEFSDIIKDIDEMDADVITFEASRSDLAIIDVLNRCGFKTAVGPGVYDVHSPRIPGTEEIKEAVFKMLKKIPKEKLWVNPDCGLKTRGNAETIPSLKNLVNAAQEVRRSLHENIRIFNNKTVLSLEIFLPSAPPQLESYTKRLKSCKD